MKPILIVGAGPTGLMTALQLARRGIAFDIIDAAAQPGEFSRAIAVHARTLEFYHQLGLADSILPLGTMANQIQLRESGKDRARISVGEVGTGLSRFPFIFILPQDDHEKFLLARLADLGIHVQRQTKLTGLSQKEEGVTVTLESSDGMSTRQYAWVVGCDGAHSGVRHALGTPFDGGSYEGLFFVADISLEAEYPTEFAVNLAKGDFVLTLPLPKDGSLRLIGITENEDRNIKFSTLQPDIERLTGFQIEQVNWFSVYRVHHRVARKFRNGRVFLAGDAGHIHSPAGGQGMNTGIGDAVNLAWKLAAVVKDGAPLDLLDTYDDERLPFARTLIKTTDSAFRRMVDKGAFGLILRSFLVPYVVPLIMRAPLLRKIMFKTVSQIAISYRDSPLSAGPKGALQAGDRLPWCDDPNTYAPLVSLDWHVQIYGECSAEFRDSLDARKVALKAFPWNELLRKKGFIKDAAYVIRPDGHIGAILPGQNAGEFESYFSRFGRGAR